MKLLKNKKALSTVVTTLIILVVSVLLATVVTFYAINVTSTRVQEENVFLTKAHIWYSTADSRGLAALVIQNIGGKDIVIDKITVRGQECTWTNVYYYKTTESVTSDLTYQSGTSFTWSGNPLSQNTGGKDLTLRSSYNMIVYITNPDSISLNDVGTTVSITVYTMNAEYYKECNVEAAT